MNRVKIPVILGPTASGKSSLAIELAQSIPLQIISCDSRQVYKHLNIGTAKPPISELASVKHWLIDIIDPSESYSAHDFAQDCSKIINEHSVDNDSICICGGTGFYFSVFQNGLGGPSLETPDEFKKDCMDQISQEGVSSLYARLEHLDPLMATRLHSHDYPRIIRALFVIETTGQSLASYEHTQSHDLDFFIIKINRERDVLYDRINKRVDFMIKEGLFDEFRSLIKDKGYSENTNGLNSVGYKELFPVLENKESLDSAIEKIKRNSRKYAKRQMTWLRNKVNGTFYELSGKNSINNIIEVIKKNLNY